MCAILLPIMFQLELPQRDLFRFILLILATVISIMGLVVSDTVEHQIKIDTIKQYQDGKIKVDTIYTEPTIEIKDLA